MKLPDHLIKNYLQRRMNEVLLCNQSLENNNLDFLATVGHQLKGNGTMYGFPSISEVGEKLEKAALQKNHTTILKILDEYQKILGELNLSQNHPPL